MNLIDDDKLHHSHPARLSLSLNFAVFFFEIRDSPDEAIAIARRAFDLANPLIDSIPEEFYQESTALLQLLHDNIIIWTAYAREDEEKLQDSNRIN